MKRCATFMLLLSITFSGYAQEKELAESKFLKGLSDAAIELTKNKVDYDPSYFAIDYPNGDIPAHLGVNSDVIIRAYRKMGIDLQKEVHIDMLEHLDLYPIDTWGQTEPDTNIDHRRIPNLQIFFSRKGKQLTLDQENSSYGPGDIVIWKMNNGKPHIGIVTDKKSQYGTPLVVHNSASGQRLQNVLFHFEIVGHYRYSGEDNSSKEENL